MLFGEDSTVMFLAIALDDRCQRGQHVGHRTSPAIQRDINPALVNLAADIGEARLFLVETAGPVHMRRGDQPAVQPVGPGMIGAGEPPGIALALDKPHHPVATGIGMRPHRAVLAAHKDDRLWPHLESHVVAGSGDFIGPAGTQPACPENPLLLQREDVRRGIHALWRGLGLGERARAERLQFGKDAFDSHLPSR